MIIERQDWPLWLGEAEGDPSSLLRPARGRPAAMAGRKSRGQRPQRRSRVAQANNCCGPDATLM